MELSDLTPPLYYLVVCGAAQVTAFLLDKNPNINELSPSIAEHGFALAAAACKGNINIIKLLLDHGAEVNLQGGRLGSALQTAAFCGEEGAMQLLLDRGAEIDNKGGEHGSALQAAAFQGHNGVVQFLIEQGANVNLVGGIFGNALAAAAYFGYREVIRLLLDAGAAVNLKTGILYGNALYSAIAGDRIECAELLISRGAEVWPLGPELEKQLERIENFEREGMIARRLRRFQENPSDYIAAAKARQGDMRERWRFQLGW
jgi:ankyrin repeat protein